MDSESQQLFRHFVNQEAQCIVCRRDFVQGTGGNDVSESIFICRECKSLVVDDNEATPPIRNFRRRRLRRRRASRHGSSESIEDLFSQQFSQLISLVRQNHDIQVEDSDTMIATRNWPRGSRRPHSDNDTESLDHVDSLFGESDSNISFYGGDSEASLDVDREMFIQQDNESHAYSDTDIDPMHAGLDQWNSDDEDEEVEWEEVNVEETSVQFVEQNAQNLDSLSSPSRSISSAQNRRWIRWRVRRADFFADIEEPDVLPLFGNSGDYVDARGFEELLEQLAETDSSRRGAPPASASAVGSLPNIIISKHHEKNGSLLCAVCKDQLLVNTEAKQLPCFHLYHPTCILPWLCARNSCPVCRFELPTDDLEYEEGKRSTGRTTEAHDINLQNQADRFSDVSSEDDVQNEPDAVIAEHADVAGDNDAESILNRGNANGRRWYFLAAGPIVSLVGIALALWLHSSTGDRRTQCRIGGQDHQQQSDRSSSTLVLGGRGRRWWPFF